jgi:hypothetical protein
MHSPIDVVTGDMDISVVELTSSARNTGAIELVHEVNISASEVGVTREDSLVESDLESIVAWMAEEVMEVTGLGSSRHLFLGEVFRIERSLELKSYVGNGNVGSFQKFGG